MPFVSNVNLNGTCRGSTQVGMCVRIVPEKTGGNEMTLKEKVAEMDPSQLEPMIAGGVLKCPYDYPYLHVDTCDQNVPYTWDECEACWNRPCIEPEVQDD